MQAGSSLLEAWNWDLFIKAAGAFIAALGAIIQLRNLFLASRTSIKTDLEILRLLDPSHAQHDSIRQAVDHRLAKHYGVGGRPSLWKDRQRLSDLAGSGVLGLFFSYLTFSIVSDGWTWWAVIPGYFGIFGLFGAVAALMGKSVNFDASSSESS